MMETKKAATLLFLLLVCSCVPANTNETSICVFPAIFNFGASNADTGGLSATFGPFAWPNGETFFGRPAGRLCDGRLILDFIAEKLNLPYLSSYLDSLGANYSHGANFGTAGSTILRPNGTFYQSRQSPFSLDVQFAQFRQFKARTKILFEKGGFFSGLVTKPSYFTRALYTFDIGQNDLTGSFLQYNKTIKEVNMRIPEIVHQFSLIIKGLYDEGGRYFWVHNTGPFGCLAEFIVRKEIPPNKLGSDGCARDYNMVAQRFNLKLKEAMQQLRQELKLASIIYVDVYNAKHTLISQAKKYGFKEAIKACCGHGRRYNFDKDINCGYTAKVNGTNVLVGKSCPNPAEYVNWDGVHYTEAANKWVFNQITNGYYTDPPVLLNMLCHITTT